MLNDWKMQLYWWLPVRLQEMALGIYAKKLDKIYYGEEYKRYERWVREFKGHSPDQVKDWGNQQLLYIVDIASKHVPYYKRHFKSVNINNVMSESDLPLLPFLDKQSIRLNESAFIADHRTPKSLWLEKTSGTTGTSLKIFWPMSMVPRWWAIYEVMCRNVAGVDQEIPRAMMGGRPVVKGSTAEPPYWRFNTVWRQLYLSSYHVSEDTAGEYVKALRKYKSQWITGYGSAIASLAESAIQAGIEHYPLKAAIVSGDTLLHGMRSSIEKFFHCKCYDHYGQAEGVAMAMECPHGKLHVIPMVGIIEIIRDDGSPCKKGEVGEIVATSLLNDAMPLIRYRTGDYAAWAIEQNCTCGNLNPIITNLEGRVDDYLVTSDGRRIGRLSTAMKRSPTIHSAQIVQDRPGHAYLLVRPGDGYKRSDAIAISNDIQERIGHFDFELVEVSEIPKTHQGKTALVIRLDDRPSMADNYKHLLN